MSDTCIVCLGDLESANALPHPLVGAVKLEDDDHGGPVPSALVPPKISDNNQNEMIAHLLPCGHDLHNECLKPWVERANSCPICRQSFNQVDLSNKVGGPIISSYPVSDRTQIAEIDPSMLIEDYDEEEPEEQPCPVCGDDDNEDVLLQCDGCDTYYHTYCVGLDGVPIGHWFCEPCETQRTAIESVFPADSTHSRSARRSHHTADRRTRGQQQRVRNTNQASASGWARVWQQVWDRLNLDLDFPFEEANDTNTLDRTQRAVSQRGGLSQWERRFQVAARQGAANRFRDTASALLDIHAVRERPEVPEQESNEEIRAWNALEKAKEIDLDPIPKRKRKSSTTSPSDAEPVPETERPLKRPRTRRILDHVDASSHALAEASGSRQSSPARPSGLRTPSAHVAASPANGPTFLQSMLREIETSNTPDESKAARYSMQSATGHSSPQPSSPSASPTTSNHPSPRARSLTPPPSLFTRTGSPTLLTSKVEPIYPPPEFSPIRSPDATFAYRPSDESRQRLKDRRQSRALQQGSSLPRSQETSPTRENMPLSTKSDLQKMVTSALKPHYHNNTVSKDQYTDINRNVSRMLYDKAGETGSIEGEARETYERLASEEVSRAVKSLKAST